MEKQVAATTRTAGEIGKLLQRQFCKGPRATDVVLAPPYLVLYLHDFLAPMERTLLDQQRSDTVHQCRTMAFDHLGTSLQATVQTHLHFVPTEMHMDWNLSQASAMILLVGEVSGAHACPSFNTTADRPADTSSTTSMGLHPSTGAWASWGWMNERLFLAKRENVVTPFEEAMIAEHDPRFVERQRAQADKQGIHGERLTHTFQRPLQEVFVTGSLEAAHSYTLLCFGAPSR